MFSFSRKKKGYSPTSARADFIKSLRSLSFEQDSSLVRVTGESHPTLGFGLYLEPTLFPGFDTDVAVESAIQQLPQDSVVQFSVLSTPTVGAKLDRWLNARLHSNTIPLLADVARARVQMMRDAATDKSLLEERLHPRQRLYFAFVQVPLTGHVARAYPEVQFPQVVTEVQHRFQAALRGGNIESTVMEEADHRFLWAELLNQHLPIERRTAMAHATGSSLNETVFGDEVKVQFAEPARLALGSAADDNSVEIAALTVDAYPREVYSQMTAQVLGHPMARSDRISAPFWAYTTVHVVDRESAQRTAHRHVLASRRSGSSAPQDAERFLNELNKGHAAVRAYTGINVYAPREEIGQEVEFVANHWRKGGFRISEETQVGIPAIAASLPFQYTPAIDAPSKGLQRARLMTSLHAATLMHIQGAQTRASRYVTPPNVSGTLLVSRHGELATFTPWNPETANHNFLLVGQAGSGKSMLVMDTVTDVLASGGRVRAIDLWLVTTPIQRALGGQHIVLEEESPKSVNPLYGLKTREQLYDAMPLLKTVVLRLAYDEENLEDIPASMFHLCERAIEAAWESHGELAELKSVHDWLSGVDDSQARSLAARLFPWASGDAAPWFNGPRQVEFNADLCAVETLEIKNAPLRERIYSALLLMCALERFPYAAYPARRQLTLLEQYSFGKSEQEGLLVEQLMRQARKSDAAVGVLAQDRGGLSWLPGGRAALNNAAHHLLMQQKRDATDFDWSAKLFANEAEAELAKTVCSGKGYSEVLIQSECGPRGVFRFIVDPLSLYLYSGNPRHLLKATDLCNQGVDEAEILHRLAADGPEYKVWRRKE